LGRYALEVFDRPVFLGAAGIRMNDGEIFTVGRRDADARRRGGQRLRREERKRQMRHGFAELRTIRAVPGINFIEGL